MMEHLVHCGRDGELIELNKQIILLVETELRGGGFQRRNIFGIEMKIAPRGDLEAVTDAGLQIIPGGANASEIKTVFTAGVGSGHHVRNAVRNGSFGHSERLFDGFCAIVDPRKNVAVQVNHVGASSASPCPERLPCAEQKKKRGKYLAHATRFDSPCDFRSEDAAEKESWNQKNAG